jgi:lactoylglutathione lyase
MPKIAAVSIYVDDMDKAIAFYRDILGFAVRARPVPFITELEHDAPALILCQAERPARSDYPNAAGTVVGIASTNVAARAQELARKKVDLVHTTPQDFPGGKYIALRDPAGTWWSYSSFQSDHATSRQAAAFSSPLSIARARSGAVPKNSDGAAPANCQKSRMRCA